MRPRTFPLLLALPILVFSDGAHAASYLLSESNGRNQITFESKAPSEYIEGTVGRLSGTVEFDPGKHTPLSALISVPVASMSTDLPARDEHMMNEEWLSAERYPAIVFALDGTASRLVSKGTNAWFVNAAGRFSLKGVTKRIMVPTTLRLEKKGKEDRLIIEGRFPVPIEEHGIHGPSAMRVIGLKVAPVVQVHFKLIGVMDPGCGALPVSNKSKKTR